MERSLTDVSPSDDVAGHPLAGAAPAQLDSQLIARLRQRGHRVTAQRLFIHRALRERALSCTDNHLTAEQLLDQVSETLPSISLPTVYATLELFEELGVVHRVSTGQGPVLFDANTAPHAHTVCRRCGRVADVKRSEHLAKEPDAAGFETAIERMSATGFQPEHAQLLIWGLCSACRSAA